MFGNISFEPTTFFGFMLGFVLGTTFHEFMHAYSALLLGDTTAQQQGRVTLNPVAHFDPYGFSMGVLLALGLPLIAWGRPVPVSPPALRFGRRGMAIVAVAGPLSNLAFATVLLMIVKLGSTALPLDAQLIIVNMITINLLLFSFNLIPIPPLDGFNILVGVLPNYWTIVLEPLRRYSLPILLGLIFIIPYIGQIIHIPLNPVSVALAPVQQALGKIFLGGL